MGGAKRDPWLCRSALIGEHRAARSQREQNELTTIFAASAISILNMTAPELEHGKRLLFVLRVVKAGDDVRAGRWTYGAALTFFASFRAVAKP
jgi:hypothetical protein